MGQAKVGKKLLCVNGNQTFHRLDLDHEPPVDDQVRLKRGRKADAFVLDVDNALARDRVAHPSQLIGKDRFVDAFKQPWPKITMKAESNVENVTTHLVDVPHFSAPPRLL